MPGRNRRAAISPVRGQGLLNFEGDCVVRERIDVVFPVLHGENGEDGSIQGLLQLAGLPYVGPGVAASATCMDKTLTKLVADRAGIRQAAWRLVTARELANNPEAVLDGVEKAFSYPVFIKPAGTGSSVGVSKAKNREALLVALTNASKYDSKILVESSSTAARSRSPCSAMPVRPRLSAARSTPARNSMTTTPNISPTAPSSISRRASRRRSQSACATTPSASMRPWGCRGLSRVDFFVTYEGQEIVFNEINTLPGFTSISMYPKLFEASGIPYPELLDNLIELALED